MRAKRRQRSTLWYESNIAYAIVFIVGFLILNYRYIKEEFFEDKGEKK